MTTIAPHRFSLPEVVALRLARVKDELQKWQREIRFVSDSAQHYFSTLKNIVMIFQIAITAHNGSLVAAQGGLGGELLVNTRTSFGPSESFRLFNRTRPGEAPHHGDAVVLQASNGRFVSAVGGGGGLLNAASEWIDASSTFTIEKVSGTGIVDSGDRIALKTANGNYVSADGGGGAVSATVTRLDAWEIFSIRIFSPQLVRLRSSAGRFVTAEEGGGGSLTANRTTVGLWETFSLINLSRSDRSIQTGDIIALQAWSGNFVRVVRPGTMNARANQVIPEARFRVDILGAIGYGQRITLQSVETMQFVTTRLGVLVADSATATSEASFRLDFAERSGISFGRVPDGAALSGRPFKVLPAQVVGERNLLTLHIYDNFETPPLTATNAQIVDAIYGRAPSLSSWLETMSSGVFSVNNAGVYGPIQVLSVAAIYKEISFLLSAAYNAGVPLESFTRDGVIDNDRVKLVKLGAGTSAQVHDAIGIGRGGISFNGIMAGVGVSRDVDEGSRMVLCHEISHLLMDVEDRYGMRVPLRGDVIANRTRIGDLERFVIERVDGPGRITGGDRVMLRAHNEKHLSVTSEAPYLINTEPEEAGDARIFTIMNLSEGDLSSGSRVGLRANNGQYLSAMLGGSSTVTANVSWMREWEHFELRKVTGGGRISSGDTVSLKSWSGFYLVAETEGRNYPRNPRDLDVEANDLRRGYVWGSGEGLGGNFDNASANYTAVMLSLYDRIRLGWVRPRYLTPDNRGCYLLRPFLDHREALILFDPQNPKEWYTVENRQYRENIDEVPSSGVAISWMCQDESYWRWWYDRANDPDVWIACPAVISAAAPETPPNVMALPLLMNPYELAKRSDPNAAFTNQELVLPLGNGNPSRFHLSFHPMSGGSVAICVR